MLHALSKLWWVLALRGLCAIVIGIGAFVVPAATLAVLILVFGAYALVEGALLLVTALGNHRAAPDRWPLLLQGLLGVAVGTLTLLSPAVTALALLFYIAAWLLAHGVLQIVVAVRLREALSGEWWLIASGVLSVLLSIWLLWQPQAGRWQCCGGSARGRWSGAPRWSAPRCASAGGAQRLGPRLA